MSEVPDDEYMVYWPNGDRNVLTSTGLAELPFDFAARIAFTNLVCGWRSFAKMTLHDSDQVQLLLKIVPIKQSTSAMSYANLE
jgi:hypothetical protein